MSEIRKSAIDLMLIDGGGAVEIDTGSMRGREEGEEPASVRAEVLSNMPGGNMD